MRRARTQLSTVASHVNNARAAHEVRLRTFIREAKLNMALGKSPRVWTGPRGPVTVGDDTEGTCNQVGEAGGSPSWKENDRGQAPEAQGGAGSVLSPRGSARGSGGTRSPGREMSRPATSRGMGLGGIRGGMLSAKAGGARPGRQLWPASDVEPEAVAPGYRAATPLRILQGKAVSFHLQNADGTDSSEGEGSPSPSRPHSGRPYSASLPVGGSGPGPDAIAYKRSASAIKSPLRQW